MNINLEFIFFKPRQKLNIDHQPCAPPRGYNFQ